jgi:hypothetical protein
MKKLIDIRRGQKKPILFSLPKKKKVFPYSSRITSGIRISTKKKMLDLPKQEQYKHNRLKGVGMFFVLFSCLILFFVGVMNIFSLQKEVKNLGEEMHKEFLEAASFLSYQNFVQGQQSLSQIEQLIKKMRYVLFPLSSHIHEKGTFDFLDKGFAHLEALVRIGKNISGKGDSIIKIPNIILSGNTKEVLPLLHFLQQELQHVRHILPDIQQTLHQYHSLPFLSENIKTVLDNLNIYFSKGEKTLDTLSFFFPAVFTLFEKETSHTVVVLFQNSSEIRATGGFPGSLAILRFHSGKIETTFHDIYELSWKLERNMPPPLGFERLAKTLLLQDANYSPDFPVSARRVKEMIKKTGMAEPETVVAITDKLLSEILREIGDIPIPGIQANITSENAGMLLTFFVEAKASGKHTPKKILQDIAPEIVSRLKDLPPKTLFDLTQKALKEKWILAYSSSPELQSFFKIIGGTGEVQHPNTTDYLSVFSANVGGNKSDRFLQESLFLVSTIDISGKITNTLRITHTHKWGVQEEKYVNSLFQQYGCYHVAPDVLRNILGAGENHSWIQVMVPKGSVLLSADHIPLENILQYEESGKTIFAFRFPKVPARESRSIELSYQLPKSDIFPEQFDMYVQSQPGRGSILVTREIALESGIHLRTEAITKKKIQHDEIFSAQLKK